MTKTIKKITVVVPIVGVFLLSSILTLSPVAGAVADPNLILHWNLNEGSGTTALDDSGNAYDGTLYNGGSYTTGHEGKGVALDGIDQYIQTPTPFGFLGTQDQEYALSAWVNLPQTGQSGNIFHMSSQMDGSGWCIPFLTLTAGHFAATGWDNNGQVEALDPSVAASNHWYQVISTWDVTNGLRLFVDGTLVATTPQAEYAASGSPMYASLGLGANACSNDQGFLNGVIDDARIYSRALLPADVQAIVSEGQPPVITAPAANQGTPAVSSQPGVPNTGMQSFPIALPVATISSGIVLSSYAIFRIRRTYKNRE